MRLARWLPLAAAPTFASMALLVGASHAQSHEMSCVTMSRVCGMATMYALMGAFHAAPWLQRISRWRGPAGSAGAPRERLGSEVG